MPEAMPRSIPTSWMTVNCPSFCCNTQTLCYDNFLQGVLHKEEATTRNSGLPDSNCIYITAATNEVTVIYESIN